MAGKATALTGQVRISDYLSVGLLSRLVPPSLVDEALTAHNRHSKRQRDLPAHAVAYYVMALSLYRGVNTEEVLRVVTEGTQQIALLNNQIYALQEKLYERLLEGQEQVQKLERAFRRITNRIVDQIANQYP